MSFSELSRRKKDDKRANLYIVVHIREQGHGLQHLMVVLPFLCQDQEADHVLDFKIY